MTNDSTVKLSALPRPLCSHGFDVFWKGITDDWKQLSIKEKNHRKALGIQPDKQIARMAYDALKQMPPIQQTLF